jgi:hypothetical protein
MDGRSILAIVMDWLEARMNAVALEEGVLCSGVYGLGRIAFMGFWIYAELISRDRV